LYRADAAGIYRADAADRENYAYIAVAILDQVAVLLNIVVVEYRRCWPYTTTNLADELSGQFGSTNLADDHPIWRTTNLADEESRDGYSFAATLCTRRFGKLDNCSSSRGATAGYASGADFARKTGGGS
jgi:hypothetical protein